MRERAFWVWEPGMGEIVPAELPAAAGADVVVRTLFSGISRGTESLVFRGGVPVDQYAKMRAPFQEGEFPGPVKYGYLNVGVVEHGPSDLAGRTVFCLYPHQTRYVVPAESVAVVPDDVPARRAVLAGMAETALNALWDAPPLIGDRITVVGAGVLGCCVTRLLSRFPEVDVQLVDVDESRATIAAAFNVGFAAPDSAAGGRDLVIHTSASSSGLRTALNLLAAEGTVLDLSWYGDTDVTVPLGGAFHSGRLTIRSSQVGSVPLARRETRSRADRLALALELLRDPAFDALITDCSPFEDLPRLMPELANGRRPGLFHLISYEESDECSA